MERIGVYIHIPFCLERCTYCDFLTFPHAFHLHDKYVNALCSEIEADARIRNLVGIEADTVYIGGGTPTILSIENIVKIMSALKHVLQISEDAEITIEMNPGTMSFEDMKSLRQVGINRISLGVQSTQDRLLQFCKRTHRKMDLFSDFESLRSVGFDNINLDFIYGIPGQTIRDIEDDLAVIQKLNPEHISWYSMILEEKTLLDFLVKKGLPIIEDEDQIKMWKLIKSGLQHFGYNQYENSNFAKAAHQSKHNMKYWTAEEYWGIGLGASSYINKERFQNVRTFGEYFEKISLSEPTWVKEERTDEEDLFEQFMMGLRLIEGMNRKKFAERNGFEILTYAPEFFEVAKKQGLLNWDEEALFLTDKGMMLQNDVLSDLLLEREKFLDE